MISFVVPAYNEERLLGPTLRAIHAAARAVGEPYEVIVVDDASSDGTVAVATSLGARVVEVAHRQIAATRNAGTRHARGDVLIFVDADTLVTGAVLCAALRELRRGAIGGGAGIRLEGRIPTYARLLQPPLVWLFRVARLAAGCFLFCTRRAFDQVGGFDETLYGAEEIALSRALGRHGRFVVLREAVTTSGRKLRAHSGWELLLVLGGIALRGPASVRARRGLELWYGKRREDPDAA
ncbi:MAG TPA: glycosyltransferase [Gemmatimonadota bacterium]|jgi:glycosyltransferase involved in cell wall biosynthesis